VIIVKGLVKKRTLLQTTYEPNTKTDKSLIEGIIYKTKKVEKLKIDEIEKLSQLSDKDYDLASISGQAVDKPVI